MGGRVVVASDVSRRQVEKRLEASARIVFRHLSDTEQALLSEDGVPARFSEDYLRAAFADGEAALAPLEAALAPAAAEAAPAEAAAAPEAADAPCAPCAVRDLDAIVRFAVGAPPHSRLLRRARRRAFGGGQEL